MSVEPEYRILVDADRATLKARLKYRVRGSEIGALAIDLPGWQLEDGDPDNLIAFDAVIGQTGAVSLPLMQRPVGPLEVTIRASRKIAGDAKTLALELPRPRGDLLSPATVAILPADNVELTPTPAATVGLAPQQATPLLDLSAERADRQQEPLCYRADPSRAVFAAGFRVHRQKIAVGVATQVRLEERTARVRQTLLYTVMHQRQDELTLEVPRSLAGPKQIEVLVDNRAATPTDLPDSGDAPGREGTVRKRLRLWPGCLGSCEVTIQYDLDLKDLGPDSSIPLVVPLVMPVEGELTENKATVVAGDGLWVRASGGTWKPGGVPAPRDLQRRTLQWIAEARTPELRLTVHREESSVSGSALAQRAWVQTWLVGPYRQDRAVFLVASDQKTVDLVVPSGVQPRDVRLWVDGKPAAADVASDGRLSVALGGEPAAALHRVELICQFREARPGPGQMSLELPRLGRGVFVHRTYWELVLAPTEHLLVPPEGLVPEYQWDWNGLLWGRKAGLEQARLETWAGARHLPGPSAEVNRYLFSAVGTPEACDLRTSSRATLVLAASGLLLVAGLVVIYVPAVRHPVVLLLAAILLGSAAILVPEPALLTAQAASFGVVLVILAAWLRRAVSVSSQGVLLRQTASSVVDRGSTLSLSPATPAVDAPAAAEEQTESPMPVSDPRP